MLVEVTDDGVGGADPGNGSGLRGLADRLWVLDGRLDVCSPTGQGTTIRATIPCRWLSSAGEIAHPLTNTVALAQSPIEHF